MSEGIIIALITLCGTLVGVFWSARVTQDKVAQQLETQQAVTETKIDHLTEEVRRHNEFAQRIPHIEGRLDILDERVKVANNRIKDLEDRTA